MGVFFNYYLFIYYSYFFISFFLILCFFLFCGFCALNTILVYLKYLISLTRRIYYYYLNYLRCDMHVNIKI